MTYYRCYFLDAADHIRGAENIETETLVVAIERALALLRQRPQHDGIELWQGRRKVYPASSTPID